MVAGEGGPEFGVPLVSGALVSAEVVEQGRGPKIIIFKKKRRQNYRRKRGHRQELTTVRILEILTGGKAPAKVAKANPEEHLRLRQQLLNRKSRARKRPKQASSFEILKAKNHGT